MSWVKGTTTYGNLVSDLTKLIAGEIADGGGNTVAVGDRWIRDHAVQDLLRTPASLDLATGNVSNRAGYFAQLSQLNAPASAGYVVAPTPHVSVCRQTACWSAKPTGIGAGNRWAMLVTVQTPNSVAGNYSTAQVSIYIMDLDAAPGVVSPTIFVGSGLLLNSAGSITISPGGGTCTINLTNPVTGILETSGFLRSYNSVYLGGVDWHGPFYWRRTGAPTFSVNPPGTATTDFDYDVAFAGSFGYAQSTTNAVSNNINAGHGWIPPGGTGQGVGIKTNTALTGALYTLSWTMAAMKIRMRTNAILGVNAGQVDLEFNGCIESDGTNYQRVGNFITMSWLRAYLTPAAVTSGSFVQYWMSVKPDSIVVILNADPAQTGKLTIGGLGAFTSLKGSLDKFPWYVSGTTVDFATTASSGAKWILPYTYRQLKMRQDGSEIRDWQTGWGRCDFFAISTFLNSAPNVGVGDTDIGERQPRNVQPVGFNQNPNPASTQQMPGTTPTDSNKPNLIDGKWHLFGFLLSDRSLISSSFNETGGIGISDDQTYRGYIGGAATACPFWWLPGTQWSSGDEITDGVTGATWFMVAADYPGLVGRHVFTTNIGHGGLAVLEST